MELQWRLHLLIGCGTGVAARVASRIIDIAWGENRMGASVGNGCWGAEEVAPAGYLNDPTVRKGFWAAVQKIAVT